MATLKDISRRLQLSVTQVSRALNDHSDVNEATRARVKAMARAMNYHANVSARKLASGQSGIVGWVVQQHALLGQAGIFYEVVSGLSSQFSNRGMQFVLHIAESDESILKVYERLIGKGALDGFVLTDPAQDDLRIPYLVDRGVPFVVHGRTAQADYPYFDIDNRGLAQQSAQIMLDHGHRAIACINGLAGRSYVAARDAGYGAALAGAGLAVDTRLLCYGEMTAAHGLTSTVRLFSGDGPHPTAILCGNVAIAKGVYRALEALSLRVPQDVSVMAHDDHLPNLRASAFFPSLTVTKAPLSDSFLPLADCLAGAIAGASLQDVQKLGGYDVILRNSVAAVPDDLRQSRL
jgi:LacI family transcriptional regulator